MPEPGISGLKKGSLKAAEGEKWDLCTDPRAAATDEETAEGGETSPLDLGKLFQALWLER